MKKKFKKHPKLFISLGVLLVLLIGGTLAYYYTHDSIDNVFKTKEYSSQSIETFESPDDWKPGDTTKKEIIVKNSGDLCEDVRVYYTEKWTNKNGDELPVLQNGMPLAKILLTNQDHWVKYGNYYYYNKTLQPGDQTDTFMRAVSYSKEAINDYSCVNETDSTGNTVTCDSSGNGYDGATYTLTIHVETVYCENTPEAWGFDSRNIKSDTAIFDVGRVVNTKMKTLANGSDKDINYEDQLITGFIKSDALPNNVVTVNNKDGSGATIVPLANSYNAVNVAADYSEYPIWIWFDMGIIYWYSEANNVFFNQDCYAFMQKLANLVDISGLKDINTEKITGLSAFFANCYSLKDISVLADWDAYKNTYIEWMFSYCNSLTDISPLANWDVSKASHSAGVFRGCGSLSDISPLAGWDTRNFTSLEVFFESTIVSDISVLANWDVSNVTVMNSMLAHTLITNVDAIADWDVSKVEGMHAMFYEVSTLTDISGLSSWQTSSLNNIRSMFLSCSGITDISALANWDVSKVETMYCAFYHCTGITTLSPLSGWVTSSNKDMYSTFAGCTGLTNLTGLGSWDVSKVENMVKTFNGCTGLTSATAINNWNIIAVPYTANTEAGNGFWYMFYGCTVHPTFSKRSGTWPKVNNKFASFVPSS